MRKCRESVRLTDAVTLRALALQLTGAANGGSLFAGTLFRRLLVMTTQLHLPIDTFALKLLLERAQSLIDIIVADDDLHKAVYLQSTRGRSGAKPHNHINKRTFAPRTLVRFVIGRAVSAYRRNIKRKAPRRPATGTENSFLRHRSAAITDL